MLTLCFPFYRCRQTETARGRKSIAGGRGSSSWMGFLRCRRRDNVCHLDVKHLGLRDNDKRMRRISLMNDDRLVVSILARLFIRTVMGCFYPRGSLYTARTECMTRFFFACKTFTCWLTTSFISPVISYKGEERRLSKVQQNKSSTGHCYKLIISIKSALWTLAFDIRKKHVTYVHHWSSAHIGSSNL